MKRKWLQLSYRIESAEVRGRFGFILAKLFEEFRPFFVDYVGAEQNVDVFLHVKAEGDTPMRIGELNREQDLRPVSLQEVVLDLEVNDQQ